MKTKLMMVLLAGAVAALAARAEEPQAEEPIELVGFRLGEELDLNDAAVRQARGLGGVALVARTDERAYLEAELNEAREGWDFAVVAVDAQTRRVARITATAVFQTEEEAATRNAQLRADLLQRFGSRTTSKLSEGRAILKFHPGTKSSCVMLKALAKSEE